MNKIQSWKTLDVDFQPNVDVQVYFCKFYDIDQVKKHWSLDRKAAV